MSREGGLRAAGAGWARRAGNSPQLMLASGLLGLAAVTEAVARAAASQPDIHELLLNLLATTLLALATTLPLAVLGPTAAAVVISAACVLSLAVFRTLTAAGMCALLIAVYQLGRDRSPQSAGRLLAPGLAAPFLVLALIGHTNTEAAVLTLLLASAGPAAGLAGIADRARHEALRHDTARQAIASTLGEHTARDERARIARELHDVVAHHISMIAVQAETARLTTADLPAAGAQRLAAIGDTARAGLTEMRQLLGVLRTDGNVQEDRHPLPGLKDLTDLIDNARIASGAGTRLIVSGSPAGLKPGTELAAYRIVQEALTNARRHAPGAAVDVELHYAKSALRLRIRDNGPGPGAAAQPGGHGLHGMRERARAVGGVLRTGSTRGGGFAVEALLPAHPDGSPP